VETLAELFAEPDHAWIRLLTVASSKVFQMPDEALVARC
jgi:hypothetical protein